MSTYDNPTAAPLPPEVDRVRVTKYRVIEVIDSTATLEIPGGGGATVQCAVPLNLAGTVGAGQWAHLIVQAGVLWMFATTLIEGA